MGATDHGRAQSGFSLFELAVSLGLIGVFCAALLQRMLYLQEYAEMTAMDLTVANLRTGLRYKTGELLLRDKVSEIATLADENPVNWLEGKPANYLGEFEMAPDVDLRGKWYFDKKRHELVYTVNNRRHFVPGAGQEFAFRWHALSVQESDKAKPGAAASQHWVTLIQTAGGQWF